MLKRAKIALAECYCRNEISFCQVIPFSNIVHARASYHLYYFHAAMDPIGFAEERSTAGGLFHMAVLLYSALGTLNF